MLTRPARPIHTVPTGLPGSPARRMAMPVADTATSQPMRSGAFGHGKYAASLTAPDQGDVSRLTPNTSRFTPEE